MRTLSNARCPARRFRWVTGFDGGARSAGTAQRAVVIEPFVETRWQRATEAGIDVSPLSMFAGDSTPAEAGYAHLRWTLGRLDACPIALVAARAAPPAMPELFRRHFERRRTRLDYANGVSSTNEFRNSIYFTHRALRWCPLRAKSINIELPLEAEGALEQGARGIGL